MSRALPAMVLAATLLFAVTASAHVERPAYWPDPAPDTSVKPATGGTFPKARHLASALRKKLPGTTRVVCQPNSLVLAKQSIARARREGFDLRPSDKRKLTAKRAKALLSINKQLKKMCRFKEIQPAVTASRNNDRVVVMPGLYTEPTSRAKPTNDPACDQYRTNGDKPGQEGTALSYEYQFRCPNDQNLIAVMGRALSDKKPPMPPREDRHGIPDEGKCIRCNFQIEGSGVDADDVIIEAGDASKGDGGPNGVGTAKDVAIRADRVDGFVLKNLKVRHAKEHGIYVLESDGYLLTNFKAFYNGLYGTLTFTADHGVTQNCDAVGHGDSGVYPGAAAETGAQRKPGTEFRYNQVVRFCDLHHNMAGYSGTNGNAVHVHDNNIYDNALGLQTDVVTAPGHPGFPGDSMLVENNLFYDNNFNVYEEDSSVVPAFPFPVGTGLWIAGGNKHVVRKNHFWDNWRRGTMLFSVPDQLVCGEAADGNQQAGCNPNGQSTSFDNSHHDNVMGMRPDGTVDPNGVDFWWDPYPGTTGNCWWDNKAAPGKQITYSPAEPPRAPFPDCDGGKNRSESIGNGDFRQTGELLSCVAAFETRQFDPNGPCPWFKTPPEPQPNGGGGQGKNSTAMDPTAMDPIASPFAVRSATGTYDRRKDLSGTTCTDWNAATEDDQAWLVGAITRFAGGTVNDHEKVVGYGDTLSTEQAHGLFDGQCAQHHARGFLLYKLYTYAAVLTEQDGS